MSLSNKSQNIIKNIITFIQLRDFKNISLEVNKITSINQGLLIIQELKQKLIKEYNNIINNIKNNIILIDEYIEDLPYYIILFLFINIKDKQGININIGNFDKHKNILILTQIEYYTIINYTIKDIKNILLILSDDLLNYINKILSNQNNIFTRFKYTYLEYLNIEEYNEKIKEYNDYLLLSMDFIYCYYIDFKKYNIKNNKIILMNKILFCDF